MVMHLTLTDLMVIGLVKAGINILLNRLIVDRLEQGRLTLATTMDSGCVMVSVY